MLVLFALLKDKIMKYYAKQLVNKHELLKTREGSYDTVADGYIKLDKFLNTAGLQARTVKVRVQRCLCVQKIYNFL